MRGNINTCKALYEKHKYKAGDFIRVKNDGLNSSTTGTVKEGEVLKITSINDKNFFARTNYEKCGGIWFDEIEPVTKPLYSIY